MKTVRYSDLPDAHKEAIRDFYYSNRLLWNEDKFGELFNEYFKCMHYQGIDGVWYFTFTDENYTWFMLRW